MQTAGCNSSGPSSRTANAVPPALVRDAQRALAQLRHRLQKPPVARLRTERLERRRDHRPVTHGDRADRRPGAVRERHGVRIGCGHTTTVSGRAPRRRCTATTAPVSGSARCWGDRRRTAPPHRACTKIRSPNRLRVGTELASSCALQRAIVFTAPGDEDGPRRRGQRVTRFLSLARPDANAEEGRDDLAASRRFEHSRFRPVCERVRTVAPDARLGRSRVAGGIAAPGSHRSRRDSLPSPGSSDQP